MCDYFLKALSLKGNLSDRESEIRLSLPNLNFKSSTWLVCLRDISYENKSTQSLSVFAQIRCNLVRDLRLHNLATQSYMPVIGTVLIKASSREKKIVYFEKCWFEINAPDDTLKITFVDPITEKPLTNNFDIFVSVLLKQLK